MVGSANYSLLQNAVGLRSVWDLDKVVLKASYDHTSYTTLTSSPQHRKWHQYRHARPRGDVASLSAGYRLAPPTQLGVELGRSLLNYEPSQADFYVSGTEWNAGVFVDSQVTRYSYPCQRRLHGVSSRLGAVRAAGISRCLRAGDN